MKMKSPNQGQPEIMIEVERDEIKRENIRKAREKVNWKVYGDVGTAGLLHIKSTTLVSGMQKMG